MNNYFLGWRLWMIILLLVLMAALSVSVRLQYVDNVRLKQENQSMLAERDAARAQFSHYEQAIALFNQIAGATQDAHQQAVQEFQPRIIQIREAITPEHCARLPVPDTAAQQLKDHRSKMRPVDAYSGKAY